MGDFYHKFSALNGIGESLLLRLCRCRSEVAPPPLKAMMRQGGATLRTPRADVRTKSEKLGTSEDQVSTPGRSPSSRSLAAPGSHENGGEGGGGHSQSTMPRPSGVASLAVPGNTLRRASYGKDSPTMARRLGNVMGLVTPRGSGSSSGQQVGEFLPLFLDPTMEPMLRALTKRFPETPPELAEVKGYNELLAARGEHLPAIEPYFHVLVDSVHWRNEALRCLIESSAHFGTLDLNANLPLTQAFLNLFTRFVKLHMLLVDWGTAIPRKLAAAFNFLSSNAGGGAGGAGDASADFLAVASWINAFDGTVTALAQDTAPLASRLGDCIRQCLSDALRRTRDVATLRKTGALSLTLKEDELTLPATPGSGQCLELLVHADLYDWLVHAFIGCPSLLETQDDSVMDALGLVIREAHVCTIYRDYVFYPADVLDGLVQTASKSKGAKEAHKKLTKWTKDKEFAGPSVFARHRELRVYIAQELQTIDRMFSDTPGLAGPKLPIALAGLAAAASELSFYFRHMDTPPPSRRYKPDDVVDLRVSELLYAADQVAHHLRDPSVRRLIHSYYAEYLSGPDAARLAELAGDTGLTGAVGGVAECLTAMANSCQQAAQAVEQSLAYPEPPGPQALPARPVHWPQFREKWFAMLAGLSEPQHITALLHHGPALGDVAAAASHVQYAEALDSMLADHTSLRHLWHYKDAFLGSLERALHDGPNQPSHLMAYLRVVASVHTAGSQFWPRVHLRSGKQAVHLANKILVKMAKRVCFLVHEVALRRIRLTRFVQDADALAHHVFVKSSRSWQPPKGYQAPRVPGQESAFGKRGHSEVEEIRVLVRNCEQLCAVLNSVDREPVFHHFFVPREFLRDKLRQQLRQFLRKCVASGSGKGVIQRPTVVETHLSVYMVAMLTVEERVGIDVSALVRQVLLDEVWTPAAGSVDRVDHVAGSADPTPAPAAGSRPTPPRLGLSHGSGIDGDDEDPGLGGAGSPRLEDSANKTITGLAEWCTQFVLQRTKQAGVVFSPARRGWAVRAGSNAAEDWVDLTEMRALCRIIGPYGVRLLEAPLLRAVGERVQSMRQALLVCAKPLGQMAKRYMDPAAVEQVVKGCKQHIDGFVADSVQVGNVQHMRSLLHSALSDVMRSDAPFVQQACETAFHNYRANLWSGDAAAAAPPPLTAMDLLATSAGVDVGVTDPAFDHVLPVSANGDDYELWGLLPAMYAVQFYGKVWTETFFNSSADGFLNNMHSQCLAMIHLLVATAVRSPECRDEASLRRFLLSFLEMASCQVLRIVGGIAKLKVDPRAAVVFMDKFVEQCPLLTRDDLELFMPYTLIRNQYTALYSGKIGKLNTEVF